MERRYIFEKLNTIFIDTLDLDTCSLTETSSANDFEEWDSLSNIELVVAIGKAFNIRFSSQEIMKWHSVGDMVNTIQDKLKSVSNVANTDSSLEIRSIWSDVISPSEIEDFRYVVNTVFGPYCTMEYFCRKYIDNIYGPSLLYIAYLDGQPVGADALWRNDINGRKTYYSADTCVISSNNATMVFGAITKAKNEFATKNDAVLFTFPNQNSFPGFKGMGWDITPFYRCPLFYRFRFFAIPLLFFRSVPKINKEHALWWLQFRIRKGVCRYKLLGRYYLVKRGSKKRVCVLGRVDKDTAMAFPKLEQPYGVWFFYTPKAGLFGKRFGYINGISYNTKNVKYEYWETDAV